MKAKIIPYYHFAARTILFDLKAAQILQNIILVIAIKQFKLI